MYNISLGSIDELIIHNIGNKNNGDGVRFSDAVTSLENVAEIVNKLIVSNFKFEELYHFHFLPTLELNPMYNFVGAIFKDNGQENFIEQSKNAGRYLYDKSTHPQIKPGELCIFYIADCTINNKSVDCVGIFKSENKETILKIEDKKTKYGLTNVSGLNIHKLDKGCLIFNTEQENGYLISIIDNTNKGGEAQYWKDEFLSVLISNTNFTQTNQFLGIAKQFVTKKLDEEFEITKADKIDYLNRSVDYFKNHDTFDKQEFEKEVFHHPNVIKSFRQFDETYRQENEVALSDNFEISAQAVKKQARVFKNVLKLDKNFHIYIHGNRELIEHGIDENGRKFYKIYYEQES